MHRNKPREATQGKLPPAGACHDGRGAQGEGDGAGPHQPAPRTGPPPAPAGGAAFPSPRRLFPQTQRGGALGAAGTGSPSRRPVSQLRALRPRPATSGGRGRRTAATEPQGEGKEGLGTCLSLSNTSCRHLGSHHPLPARRVEPEVTWPPQPPRKQSPEGQGRGKFRGATLPRRHPGGTLNPSAG